MLTHNYLITNIISVPAVTARCDEATPGINIQSPCNHLTMSSGSLPLIQPGQCLKGAPPSTSLTSNKCCNTPTVATTSAQYGTSTNPVQQYNVKAHCVPPKFSKPVAALEPPDVHELHGDFGHGGGGGGGAKVGMWCDSGLHYTIS